MSATMILCTANKNNNMYVTIYMSDNSLETPLELSLATSDIESP